ncbi:hypothetical protein O159_22830 [Leifsonia xyli subsp. cynodontis DSM 46306]|jgi:hypothetical protein|uniref:Uncharacterized protein n=1 Tax=Leifsonia xyli subsp. cynodontis DSM 46306 TaxID=1389489 RepID=U3P8T7_LEIXC|nr:hypothetical protein [Leifsonia xyli]AGW41723.1 hypothetical protein O159_16780 [Leifsonia xyli subsp. cynodontis DSM 46306]AGW42246.1 hypothetical protein O159_22830 [Leifsonia xyli subsp. cynodontis DSM 46306]
MAWFKVDDGFWSHPKTLRLSTAAVALWVRAGSWSSQQLTDGVIEHHVLGMFGATAKVARELVDVGYWEIDARGYVFHDWQDYQEESEKVKARREAARERMRTVRANRTRTEPEHANERSDEHAEKFAGSSEEVRLTPTRPDPTYLTTPDGVVARTRGTRIPEPFVVTGQMRAWAASEVPAVDVDAATRKFVDHWRAKSGRDGTKRDWTAAWRNWLRTDAERKPQARPDKDERALSVIEMGQRMAAADAGARREVTA